MTSDRKQSHLSLKGAGAGELRPPRLPRVRICSEHMTSLPPGARSSVRRTTSRSTIAPKGGRMDASPRARRRGDPVLAEERLRARLHVKVFVDTDDDIRLMRGSAGDLEQRGRTFAQMRKQYYETVRPMHIAFVEPSKRFADIIVPEGGRIWSPSTSSSATSGRGCSRPSPRRQELTTRTCSHEPPTLQVRCFRRTGGGCRVRCEVGCSPDGASDSGGASAV